MNGRMVAFLVAFAVATGVAGLLYPVIVRDVMRRRAETISASTEEKETAKRGVAEIAKRRKAIAESLKDVGAKNKKITLEQKVDQAGLTISSQNFLLASIGFGLFLAVIVYIFGNDVLIAAGAGVVGVFGLPNWLLSFLAKRRIAKFVDGFPNAIEVIIRGVKAGLPVSDCFRVIASESPEPLRSEFRLIVDAQSVGLSIAEAADRLAKRIPIPETSFFATVINIQQNAGGNLSEALGNLASVLRQRKAMKEKIKAISSEAKASAMIIGSLPFIVGILVYFSSPDYLTVLFTTTGGKMIIGGGLTWMSIGILIMRNMINFDI